MRDIPLVDELQQDNIGELLQDIVEMHVTDQAWRACSPKRRYKFNHSIDITDDSVKNMANYLRDGLTYRVLTQIHEFSRVIKRHIKALLELSAFTAKNGHRRP